MDRRSFLTVAGACLAPTMGHACFGESRAMTRVLDATVSFMPRRLIVPLRLSSGQSSRSPKLSLPSPWKSTVDEQPGEG